MTRTHIFIIIAILISISFASSAETGGFDVAILPKMSTISREEIGMHKHSIGSKPYSKAKSGN